MNKDFNTWSTIKKQIHQDNVNRFYLERQIWWISFGTNIGSEEDGKGEFVKRPGIIVKGFSKETCLVVPLTTVAGMLPYCLHIGIVQGQDSFALPYQMRSIDTKRFLNRIGLLNIQKYQSLQQVLRDYFTTPHSSIHLSTSAPLSTVSLASQHE